MASKCKGCGADVIWSRTTAGKPMILDAEPEKRVVIVKAFCRVVDTYTPHWATCPEAGKFRKRGKDG